MSCYAFRNLRPRIAFTLVELLVVIGIIAVLIGILLPSLGRARHVARTAVCASNLRQLANGWMLYAQAHGGIVCPARLPELPGQKAYDLGNGPHHRPRWYDIIGAQVNIHPLLRPTGVSNDDEHVTSPAFLCPERPEWDNARNYPYGYNFQFLGNMRPQSNGRPIHYPVKVSGLKGSETVLAADSLGCASGKPRALRTGYRADGVHDVTAIGDHAYTIDPPRLTADSDYTDDGHRTPADRSAPDPRHSRKASVAFCDGHVELLGLADMGYVVLADEQVAVDGPGVHNRLFSGTGRDDDPPRVE